MFVETRTTLCHYIFRTKCPAFFFRFFGLLNVLPDGTEVAHPLKAIGQLQEQAPAHPYVKMGMEVFSRLTGEAERFFEEVGIHMREAP